MHATLANISGSNKLFFFFVLQCTSTVWSGAEWSTSSCLRNGRRTSSIFQSRRSPSRRRGRCTTRRCSCCRSRVSHRQRERERRSRSFELRRTNVDRSAVRIQDSTTTRANYGPKKKEFSGDWRSRGIIRFYIFSAGWSNISLRAFIIIWYYVLCLSQAHASMDLHTIQNVNSHQYCPPELPQSRKTRPDILWSKFIWL